MHSTGVDKITLLRSLSVKLPATVYTKSRAARSIFVLKHNMSTMADKLQQLHKFSACDVSVELQNHHKVSKSSQ